MDTIAIPDRTRLEEWITNNSTQLALGAIALAFVLRLAYANACFLNPDEAIHFSAARPNSWYEAYEASRNISHPPLLVLLLHAILFFGRSELILRLPSVIAGTVALWPAFAWMRHEFGEMTALAGLAFMALSPASISASTEVRQYGLLLCFVCCALYATQRSLAERSIFWAVVQGLFLLAALLANYTVLVVAACLVVYVGLYALFNGIPRRIVVTMAAFQLLFAALLAWLYFRHLSPSFTAGPAAGLSYLKPYFYRPGQETALGFLWRSMYGTFSHAVGSSHLALLTLLCFLAGIAAILANRTRAQGLSAVWIVTPFVVGFAAAAVHAFPFAGTRHQAYLLPFLAVGVAACLTWLPQWWAVRVLIAAIVTAGPFWILHGGTDNDRRYLPLRDMNRAIEYIHDTIPPGATLFADRETREILEYYLARYDHNLDRFREGQVTGGKSQEEGLGGYRVVVPSRRVWGFSLDGLLHEVNTSRSALGVPPGGPLWIVKGDWYLRSSESVSPPGAAPDAKQFGVIRVIQTNAPDQPQHPSGSEGAEQTLHTQHAAMDQMH